MLQVRDKFKSLHKLRKTQVTSIEADRVVYLRQASEEANSIITANE